MHEDVIRKLVEGVFSVLHAQGAPGHPQQRRAVEGREVRGAGRAVARVAREASLCLGALALLGGCGLELDLASLAWGISARCPSDR